MPITYFDTNIYDHIDKTYIPAGEVEAVRVVLASGDLIAYFSIAGKSGGSSPAN